LRQSVRAVLTLYLIHDGCNGCNARNGCNRHLCCNGRSGCGTVPSMDKPLGMVVALAAEKGGCGKSTLAINLAACWHDLGLRVLLCDADPQGTAIQWAEVSEAAGVRGPSVIAAGDNLRTALGPLVAQHDVTVIDTPGRMGRRLAAAMMLADLVLVPAAPSTADVWALGGLLDTLEQAREIRPDLRAALVVNRADGRTRIGKASTDALAGVTDLERCPVTIATRVAFPEALAAGQGVTAHAPGSIAALELRKLADWCADALRLYQDGAAA